MQTLCGESMWLWLLLGADANALSRLCSIKVSIFVRVLGKSESTHMEHGVRIDGGAVSHDLTALLADIPALHHRCLGHLVVRGLLPSWSPLLVACVQGRRPRHFGDGGAGVVGDGSDGNLK